MKHIIFIIPIQRYREAAQHYKNRAAMPLDGSLLSGTGGLQARLRIRLQAEVGGRLLLFAIWNILTYNFEYDVGMRFQVNDYAEY